MYLVPLVK